MFYMETSSIITYRVNAQDEIYYVSSSYDEFALENDGAAFLSNNILHRPLWEFVTDATIKLLYGDMMQRVRRGHEMRFPFRCDSPTCRRLLEMNMIRLGNRAIEFQVRTLLLEPQPMQKLWAADAPRSKKLLRVCSWCKKIDVNGAWKELEEAVRGVHLFEGPKLPMVTHGICEPCLEKVMRLHR